MKHISISVVVPVLNEKTQLPELLQMLAQLDADEVILVDGESTDGTATLLAESGFYYYKSRPGRAIQMNKGAEMCQSDVILFLHADTKITAALLNRVRNMMRDPGTVGGRFDLSLSGTHPIFRLIEFMINLRSRMSKISTGDQAMFVRRGVFKKLGGFPDQPLMEDVEFSKQLKSQGRVASLRDKVTTSSRRWEKHGIIKTVMLMWQLRFLYWLGVTPKRLAELYYHAR